MGGFGFSAFHEHVESFFCNLKSMIYTWTFVCEIPFPISTNYIECKHKQRNQVWRSHVSWIYWRSPYTFFF
jgi:hypothetical protein